jgi:hypothetical protein
MGKLRYIIMDCADATKVAQFWESALNGYEADAESGVILKAESGPQIAFEVVPEGKAVKNRLHLNIAADDRQAEVKRLVGLGATEVEEIDIEGYAWTNMKDVEGNEFCVSQAQ